MCAHVDTVRKLCVRVCVYVWFERLTWAFKIVSVSAVPTKSAGISIYINIYIVYIHTYLYYDICL